MKTDMPILETPRSVDVVTQQQMQERGARSLTQALQYTPGVFAGLWRQRQPRRLAVRARVRADDLPRRDAVLLRLLQQHRAGALPARQRGGAEGAGGDALRQRRRRRDRQRGLEAARSDRAQHRAAAGGDRQPVPGRASTTTASSPDGKILYRLVGLGRSADGPIDFSNNDAAAFLPSVTWAPDERTSVTVLGYYQKNDTSPYIQFLSPYGTLLLRRAVRERRLPAERRLRGRAVVQLLQRHAAGGEPVREHAFNDVWSVGGSLRYTESKLDYAQAWWAYDNFETGRYNPDGTINRTGEIAANDSHSLDRATCTPTPISCWGRRRIRRCSAPSFTDGRFNYDYGPAVAARADRSVRSGLYRHGSTAARWWTIRSIR